MIRQDAGPFARDVFGYLHEVGIGHATLVPWDRAMCLTTERPLTDQERASVEQIAVDHGIDHVLHFAFRGGHKSGERPDQCANS